MLNPCLVLIENVLFLDLDNTSMGWQLLAKMVLMELNLGQTPNGKSFVEFQKQLLSLMATGNNS